MLRRPTILFIHECKHRHMGQEFLVGKEYLKEIFGPHYFFKNLNTSMDIIMKYFFSLNQCSFYNHCICFLQT